MQLSCETERALSRRVIELVTPSLVFPGVRTAGRTRGEARARRWTGGEVFENAAWAAMALSALGALLLCCV